MAVSKEKKSRARTSRKTAKSGGGTFTGMLIGLLLGAGAVAGTAWYVVTRTSPFHIPDTLARLTDNGAPMALPGKPGDKPVVRQDFDSFSMPSVERMQANSDAGTALTPGRDDSVAVAAPVAIEPPPAAVDRSGNIGSSAAVVSQSGRLYLQVGAFENPAEAENMKALLALNGIEAVAHRTRLSNGRIVHRVRVGPFDTREEMASVRSQLSDVGVQAIPASQPM